MGLLSTILDKILPGRHANAQASAPSPTPAAPTPSWLTIGRNGADPAK